MRRRIFSLLIAVIAVWGVEISLAEELRPFEPRAAENVAKAVRWIFEENTSVRVVPTAVAMNPMRSVPDDRTRFAMFILAEDLVHMLDTAGYTYDRNYRPQRGVIEILVDPVSSGPCTVKNAKLRIRTYDPQDLVVLTVQMDDKLGSLLLPGKVVVSQSLLDLSRHYGVNQVEWARTIERFSFDVERLEVPDQKGVSCNLLQKYFEAVIKGNPVEAMYYENLAFAVPTAN